jgi:hypothetical protein
MTAAAFLPAAERDLPDRVIEWQTWQFAQSLSARTVAERTASVMRCAQWAGTDPEVLRSDQIAGWLAHGADWAARTRWTYHGALAVWFRWLEQQEYRDTNPMDKVGRPRQPRSETAAGIRRQHAAASAVANALPHQGDGAARVATRPRAHEIAKVKGEHLDLIACVIVVSGKGGVTATMPLHHLVLEQAFKMPRRGFWFPGPESGHQRRESVSGTVKEAMIRASVPRLRASAPTLFWDCARPGWRRPSHGADADETSEPRVDGHLHRGRR